MEIVQGYYKRVGLFCNIKNYSPLRRRVRKEKLKIWEKRRKTKDMAHW